MKTTAERLKEIMDEQGLKQSDIIERAKPFMEMYSTKLTRPDMSQYCNGKIVPKQNKLFLLAAALNVSEAWLMGHDVPRTRTTETTELISSDPVMAAFLRSEKSNLSEEYIKRKIKDSFDITDLERELIIAFRRTDEMTRKNILKLLDIRIKEKNQDVG